MGGRAGSSLRPLTALWALHCISPLQTLIRRNPCVAVTFPLPLPFLFAYADQDWGHRPHCLHHDGKTKTRVPSSAFLSLADPGLSVGLCLTVWQTFSEPSAPLTERPAPAPQRHCPRPPGLLGTRLPLPRPQRRPGPAPWVWSHPGPCLLRTALSPPTTRLSGCVLKSG